MRAVFILHPASGSSSMAANQDTLAEHEETLLAALHTYGVEPEIRSTTACETRSYFFTNPKKDRGGLRCNDELEMYAGESLVF
jgi:hypothetical protein